MTAGQQPTPLLVQAQVFFAQEQQLHLFVAGAVQTARLAAASTTSYFFLKQPAVLGTAYTRFSGLPAHCVQFLTQGVRPGCTCNAVPGRRAAASTRLAQQAQPFAAAVLRNIYGRRSTRPLPSRPGAFIAFFRGPSGARSTFAVNHSRSVAQRSERPRVIVQNNLRRWPAACNLSRV